TTMNLFVDTSIVPTTMVKNILISPSQTATTCNEGIDLTGGFISFRRDTCQIILERLSQSSLVFVQSPPLSGKTSLAILLEYYLKQTRPSAKVYSMTMLELDQNDGNNIAERFNCLFQRKSGSTWPVFIKVLDSLTVDTCK
ncbi:unnamed protein product, partial [Didymodactylos carnosus]